MVMREDFARNGLVAKSLQSLSYIHLCERFFAAQIEYPRISIKENGVGRFRLYGVSAVVFGYFEVALVGSEEIGVVVHHGYVLRVESKDLFVGFFQCGFRRFHRLECLQTKDEELDIEGVVFEISFGFFSCFFDIADGGIDAVSLQCTIDIVAVAPVDEVLDTECVLGVVGIEIGLLQAVKYMFVFGVEAVSGFIVRQGNVGSFDSHKEITHIAIDNGIGGAQIETELVELESVLVVGFLEKSLSLIQIVEETLSCSLVAEG